MNKKSDLKSGFKSKIPDDNSVKSRLFLKAHRLKKVNEEDESHSEEMLNGCAPEYEGSFKAENSCHTNNARETLKLTSSKDETNENDAETRNTSQFTNDLSDYDDVNIRSVSRKKLFLNAFNEPPLNIDLPETINFETLAIELPETATIDPQFVKRIINKGIKDGKIRCLACNSTSPAEGHCLNHACDKDLGNSGLCQNYKNTSAPKDFVKNTSVVDREVNKNYDTENTYNNLFKFLSSVNIPPLPKQLNNNNRKNLYKIMQNKVSDMRFRAAKVIKRYYVEKGHYINDGMIDIGVRYFNLHACCDYNVTMFSLGFVVEVETGIVLDFNILSKSCKSCKCFRNPTNFEGTLDHNADCIDNIDISTSMEIENADILFKRSANLNVRYCMYISDGEDCVYDHLKEASPYGDNHTVIKYDGLNHVVKNLFYRINKTRLQDKLLIVVGGKLKRMPEEVPREFADIYYNVVKKHGKDLAKIKLDVIASLLHRASTDRRPIHGLCSSDESSGCKFRIMELKKEEIPPDWHKKETNMKYSLYGKAGKLIVRIIMDFLTNEILNLITNFKDNTYYEMAAGVYNIESKVKLSAEDVFYSAGRLFLFHNEIPGTEQV